jgi:cytochrome b561
MDMDTDKYHGAIRIIHWIMVMLFAILFVLGIVMTEFKECCKPWTMYDFHKSTGVLVFLIVWMRILVRWRTIAPPLPEEFPLIIRRVAKAVSHLLYLFMIIAPISGYALSNVHGHAVKFYGLALPTLFAENPVYEDFVSEFHEFATYGLLALIVLHLCGVIFHHIKKQDILHRIT